MNILVCISRTPETTARIAFTEGNTAFDTQGVQYIMNPYDEWYALVRAIELKEQHGGEVHIVHVGGAESDTVLRKGLAIGADKAIRVDARASSSDYTAAQIAAIAQSGSYDVILLGKETIDYNGSELGSILAGMLDLPYVSYGSHMDLADGKARVTRDIEGGVETVELSIPLVASAAKGMAEQRIPNMRGIMMAKKKPLEVVAAIEYTPRVTAVDFSLPEAKTGVKMIDPENMDELVRLLHEEAKVI